jgi:riboflavin synthase
MYIAFPPAYRKWLIPVGSVCVDGISLTVADVADEMFKVAIIPHTLDNTTLRTRSEGDIVNLEFDMIAKYIDNLIKHP